ncbi:hypothetical protein GCM10017559_40880 [Streptosporangium longisporum]|uniref:Uncharacterized protein n=1 Tax=Streptosporangium longisporum TaxID=46187 RepID=A0ABN3Y9I4_9ACTN
MRDERVHGADVLAHHLGQLTGPAPGEPADRHASQVRRQPPPERQLHPGVEDVPEPGRGGREQQPDEQAGRARDDDRPDMTVVDGAGRQQDAAQLDDGQQRRQAREGTDDLKDHNGGETPQVGTQQPRGTPSRRGAGIR